MEKKSNATIFETLSAMNVGDHIEQRDDGKGHYLSYLSWPWAVSEMSKAYPDWTYEIAKNANGLPYVYDPATGYMVETSVTAGGETKVMWLPVMDGANRAMKAEPYTYKVKNPSFKYAKLDRESGLYFDKYGNEQKEFDVKTVQAATMFDINKAIMRCLVKNLAMFGLGLYIYAGEDLPEAPEDDEKSQEQKVELKVEKKVEQKQTPKNDAAKEVATAAKKASQGTISQEERKTMFQIASEVLGGMRDEMLKGWFKDMGISSSSEMTPDQYVEIMHRLNVVADGKMDIGATA